MASSSAGAGGRKIELPARSTRGKRMRAAMEDEEEADAEFWNQEFFAEEAEDQDYAESEEEEDVVDSDFDEPEDEEDQGDEGDVDERPKRKALKAPEPKGPPKPKPMPKPAAEPAGETATAATGPVQGSPAVAAAAAPASTEKRARGTRALAQLQLDPEQQALLLAQDQGAPNLRRSTVARVQEAQKERHQKEQARPVRARSSKGSEWRPLTQAELLAEATQTEVNNMYSLKILLAMEEETKKKAVVTKQQYRGPLVKWLSRRRLLPTTRPSSQPPDMTPAAKAGGAAAGEPKPTQSAAGTLQPAPPEAAVGGAGAVGVGVVALQAVAAGEDPPVPSPSPVRMAALEQLVRYEATLAFELHNMHYPPLWLRRWKAPQPPAPVLCVVTGARAKYRDPATKYAFSSVAAFRRIRGLPQVPTAPAPEPEQPRQRGFNATTCMFAGAGNLRAEGQAARKARAALPAPAPAPLLPPSLQMHMVHPISLPTPLMALALDVTKVPSAAAG